MLKNKYKLLNLLFLSLFLITVSCEDASGPDSVTWVPNTETIDVEWTPGTLVVDNLAKSNIVRIDTNNFIYTFKSSYDPASVLKEGDILFIHGLALRKVSSLTNESGEIVVRTEHANLNEAIANGTIEWDQGMEFDPDLVPMLAYEDKKGNIPLVKTGANTFELKFKVEKFDAVVKVVVEKEKLQVVCSLEKEVTKSIKVKYEMDGFVKRFRSKAKITFDNSFCSEFDYKNEGVEGEVKLELIATSSQDDLINGLNLPFVLFKMPFVIGGIPVTVNCKILFYVKSKMDATASSFINTTFKYNSTTGIKWDGVKTGFSGKMGPYDIKEGKMQTGSASSVGISFGVGFPRMEISLFNDAVVPWIHTAFQISGSFVNGIKPCQSADAWFYGACGYELKFLGLSQKGSKNLWEIKKELLRAGSCD